MKDQDANMLIRFSLIRYKNATRIYRGTKWKWIFEWAAMQSYVIIYRKHFANLFQLWSQQYQYRSVGTAPRSLSYAIVVNLLGHCVRGLFKTVVKSGPHTRTAHSPFGHGRNMI